ncbi:MAG: DUF2141 domain-containing protein [Pseudomonadales bacterium]|nr:DUF2141 domain-containing protein [Halioglobus sp.]MCP5121884.1 DUF2141 domain-containing protein [Pseudomonadales bacterium]MCP5192577.1 DUF2141 domain-containing protein [Pseudomonadales bacterium]
MIKLLGKLVRDAVFVIVVAGAGAGTALAQDMGTVRVEIAGLQGATGNIYIAVYDSEDNWLGKDTVLRREVAIADALEGELVLSELQLPAGSYAFSVFYDVNNNGELDTNFIGIPKEPVAISNNARPGFGPPKYKDAVFTLGAEPVVQRIEIESI